MLEELRVYFQESPSLLLVLGVLGVFCLLLIVVPLTRSVRSNMGQRLPEIPILKRTGRWIAANPETIALAIGVLCLLATVALMVKPVRLLQHGTSADGLVTSVVESTYTDTDHKTRIQSKATIRFEADGRVMQIQRSSNRKSGSWCIAGCIGRGDRLKLLYLAEDPAGAEVDSFLGLFGDALMAGISAALAFLFRWGLRSARTATKPAA